MIKSFLQFCNEIVLFSDPTTCPSEKDGGPGASARPSSPSSIPANHVPSTDPHHGGGGGGSSQRSQPRDTPGPHGKPVRGTGAGQRCTRSGRLREHATPGLPQSPAAAADIIGVRGAPNPTLPTHIWGHAAIHVPPELIGKKFLLVHCAAHPTTHQIRWRTSVHVTWYRAPIWGCTISTLCVL